ncbi:hypothetical protein [Stenotrophomonas sp.]|uniref:hypothetical protein n=1 Tax=Stenotrophomonas sp. TaxID=69392 RepID=UPI002898D215|nr:hypothetical protein [Stenotrophomonas sp.]
MSPAPVDTVPAVTLVAVRPLPDAPKKRLVNAQPLLHISNASAINPPKATSPTTHAPRLRMALFSDAGSANATSGDEVPGDALHVLTVQIHALLSELAENESPAFAKAVGQLQRDHADRLDRSAIRHIARLLKTLPPAHQASERQQLLRAATYDLTRTAEAELLLMRKVQQYTDRQKINNYPGAMRETSRGFSLGAALGLPGAGDAGITGAVSRATSTATFDDLAVATFTTTTVSGRASVEAGLPAGIGAGAHASAHLARSTGEVADKMQDRVLELARASVARKLGGPRLLRMAKRVVGPRRDRYAERVSTALAWQTRLPMLLAHGTPLRPTLFHPAPPPPIAASIRTVGGEVGAHAGAGVADLAASAGLSHTEVTSELPVRLTDDDATARALRQERSLLQGLEERLPPVLHGPDTPRSRTLQLVQDILRAPDPMPTLGKRLAAVSHLEVEFDHLEALARHALTAPSQARPPLESLARDWGSDEAGCEPVMIGMLDTLAWLQATPSPQVDRTDRADWDTLQQRVQDLANRIHDCRLPHDRQLVHRATHAFRPMTQRLATRQATAAVNAALGMVGMGARVNVARHQRDDPDPLRAGTYLDVTLTADVSYSVGELLAAMQRSLPGEWENLPTEEIGHVLQHVSPAFPSTANARFVIRLFSPRFQQEPGFPAGAKGSHLQTVRVSVGSAHGMNLTAPVPMAPGVSAKVGLQYQRLEQIPQREWLHSSTITGLLLRYNSLHTRDSSEATVWANMLERHGPDVDRLAQALATPGSVAASEARYWLHRDAGRAGLSATQRRGLAQLVALNHTSDVETQRTQVQQLFIALAEQTQRAKQASPLIGAPVLPPSTLR